MTSSTITTDRKKQLVERAYFPVEKVRLSNDEYGIINKETGDLLSRARVREFLDITDDEEHTHLVNPCPTLEYQRVKRRDICK